MTRDQIRIGMKCRYIGKNIDAYDKDIGGIYTITKLCDDTYVYVEGAFWTNVYISSLEPIGKQPRRKLSKIGKLLSRFEAKK